MELLPTTADGVLTVLFEALFLIVREIYFVSSFLILGFKYFGFMYASGS